MTVRELMEKLAECDGDAPVVNQDPDTGEFWPAYEPHVRHAYPRNRKAEGVVYSECTPRHRRAMIVVVVG